MLDHTNTLQRNDMTATLNVLGQMSLRDADVILRNWYTKFKIKQWAGWGTSHRFLSHRIHGRRASSAMFPTSVLLTH